MQMVELNDAVSVLREKHLQAEENAAKLRLEVQQLQQQNAHHTTKHSEACERESQLQRELCDKAEEIEVIHIIPLFI